MQVTIKLTDERTFLKIEAESNPQRAHVRSRASHAIEQLTPILEALSNGKEGSFFVEAFPGVVVASSDTPQAGNSEIDSQKSDKQVEEQVFRDPLKEALVEVPIEIPKRVFSDEKKEDKVPAKEEVVVPAVVDTEQPEKSEEAPAETEEE